MLPKIQFSELFNENNLVSDPKLIFYTFGRRDYSILFTKKQNRYKNVWPNLYSACVYVYMCVRTRACA